MTDAPPVIGTERGQNPQNLPWRDLLRLILLCFAGILLASAPQIMDPLLRHDDFQALFNDARGYYPKTLSEGRWLNYLWLAWSPALSAPVTYILYQACWAIYLGTLVHLAFGAGDAVWRKLSVAMIAGLAAPTLLISLWFNTLLPGLMVCAAYALLCATLSERWGRWLLLPFVPLALMGYTMNPLLLLAICLTRRDAPRSALHLAKVLALFVTSFALGMGVIYTLNLHFHGVFGIPMAAWRTPTPAYDMASALSNLVRMGDVMGIAARVVAYNFMPLTYGLLGLGGLAVVWVGRRNPWEVIYSLTGIGIGLALIAVQAVKSGVVMPPRVLGFALVFYAVLLGHVSRRLPERIARAMLAGLAMLFAMFSILQHREMVPWQHETRAMAEQIGTGPEAVFVSGTYLSLPSVLGAGIQHARGFRLRLQYLTGRQVILCEETPAACEVLSASLKGPDPETGWSLSRSAAGIELRLSDAALRPPKIPSR
ncbi:hypothetical protein [Phaeobacter sp. B1627]|uniref:hypothetical protein n=1 Tax=Phaeobacter sp. B1627 TaxID=2583809 RepID=UPI0011185FFA|nr:hypothetical protein [Phaeobacter sp. B1627]TNJ44385.1 hypothetical protein FGE21_07520 [Phaeobacter sp. B1627]